MAAVTFMYLYLLLGVVFAIVFVLVGVRAVDAYAKKTSFWFRLIILPGTILLWPVMLSKWIRAVRNGA